MNMMPAAMVINQSDSVGSADNATAVAVAAVNVRVQKETAKRVERQRTRAILADFEAHLRGLYENPPAELSPIKLQAHRESIEHTIRDLRRQIAPRRKPQPTV